MAYFSSKTTLLSLLTASVLTLPACGGMSDTGASELGGDTGAGVGQGGAQDFGQFKQILEAGEIPGPDTIDDVGFFNEHKIELPDPGCGNDVCLHGELGVMANMISGSNCTLILAGLNTPIDPSTIERRPMNLVVSIDTSGSMQGASMAYVREGLLRMLDDLKPEDRVSLVTFDFEAVVVAENVPGDDIELAAAIASLEAGGGTNIYDGLRTAYEVGEVYKDDGKQNRVIFLSDGVATEGILNDDKILAMSAGYNEGGQNLTTIGMGEGFDPTLMRTLSEEGAGAFYFLQDPAAVQEVFEEEVQTFLVPLAKDVSIDIDIDGAYDLRAIYGTKEVLITGNEGQIDIPILQIAHRESVDDNTGGRRGGGGGILLEVLPQADAPAGAVGTMTLSYTEPVTDAVVEQTVKIVNTLAAGETPEDGLFTTSGTEKGFVMLNIFMGFRMSAALAQVGDDPGALGILEGLKGGVEGWLESNDDFDIEDDLRYIDMFIANLRARGATDPIDRPVPEPWPNGD